VRDWATSNPTFATALTALESNQFFSIVVHFVAGDLWVAGRDNSAGGIAHAVIMTELGAIGSTTGRSEPLQLDVASTDLGFANMPKRSGMPGPLATGERFMDRWVRNLEAVLVDVYCNFETSPGTFVREKLFEAVCGSPSGAGYRTGQLHLASRTERYLNASVLRKIASPLYPFAHESDRNATIPIVLGAAPKSPGRVVKGSSVSVPVAASTNSSSAQLLPPEVDSAMAEQWTVTFTFTDPVYFTTTPNSWQDVGLAAHSGATEPIAAQSFDITTGPRNLRSISVRFRADGGSVFGANQYPWFAYRLEVWTDSAGEPGTLYSSSLKFNYAVAPGVPAGPVTFQDVRIRMRSPVSLPTGTYWIVVAAMPQAHRYSWTDGLNNKLQWGKNTGGGFAGGKAKKGTRTRQSPYSNWAGWGSANLHLGLTWDSALDAQDFWFQLGFGEDEFVLEGTASGADGTGTINENFVSDSGQVTIRTDRWQGRPVSGDVFTFSVDPADSQVIFSESPAATPAEIVNVYIDDERIANGTTQEEVRVLGDPAAPWVGGGSIGYLLLGYDLDYEYTYPWAYEWQGAYTSLDIVGTQTFRELGWQIWHSVAPSDTQSQNLRFVVYADIVSFGVSAPGGVYHLPNFRHVLASVEVDQERVSTVGADFSFVMADLPVFTVTDQKIWIGVETSQFDSTDFYEMPVTSGTAWTSVIRNHNGASYVGPLWGALKFGYRLVGATITIENSVDDGTGHNVARALMDFDIPDASRVTADMVGITDDSSGTYTSSPGAVLISPDSVFHWLLNRAGVADADIDLNDTFQAARAFYGDIYRFDGTIQDDSTYKTLLLKLAYECRTAFDWIALATLRVISATYTDPVATFELADVLHDADRVPTLHTERSPDSELINSMTANYNRVLADTKYTSSVARNVPDSIATYSVLERQDLANLDFVRNEQMARGVIDTLLARQAYPFWRITLSALLPFLALEKDDAVALDLTNAAEGDDALGGWDGTQVLQVEGITIQPDLPGLDFLLREVNVDVTIEDGDGYTSPLSVVVLLDQGDLTTLWDYVMGYPPHGRWTEPSTSGGTQYDGIALNAGWVLYIENGIRKWETGFVGTTFAWVGPPAARVNADEILEIDF
jgi:hypothetical protein